MLFLSILSLRQIRYHFFFLILLELFLYSGGKGWVGVSVYSKHKFYRNSRKNVVNLVKICLSVFNSSLNILLSSEDGGFVFCFCFLVMFWWSSLLSQDHPSVVRFQEILTIVVWSFQFLRGFFSTNVVISNLLITIKQM